MGRIVQGWFYKLRRTHEGNSLARHVTKAWSKRYFVIVRDRINWYKNADPNSGEKPSGFINFQEILRIRVLHAENRLDDQFNRDEYGTYSLEIVANSRRLTIRTPSRDEAMVWTYELRKKLKIWTERTGVETLREVALQRKTVDSRDKLMERIDKALANVSLKETTQNREKITLASYTDSAVSAVGSDAEDDTPIKPTKRRGKQRSKSRRSSTSSRSHETRQETKTDRQDSIKVTPSWPTKKNEMTTTLLDVPEVEHLDDFEYQPRHGRGRNSQQNPSTHRRAQDEGKLFEAASFRNKGAQNTIPTAVSCNDTNEDWLEESL
ncbi:Hypothetical Protein FCC1311_066702 [Hondaea fermentalgiana]|uniref:PH domain-containing protein n=1 Tax=Hondaea fermentalgiana TaxID=2315210 RepID=A0A2R5GQ25_9STRA|nr:Hypothetical Protein FCC1311_066702 [Hondaea fermentalgiana]|eukprot:GBG30451.1 Hypothetical Protein FCC1311_066702 [Hondaea fermentalgiana]